MSSNDRPENSLLNEMYRAFLKQRHDSSGNQRRLRQQMRDRVRRGLTDFMLLNQYMQPRDIRQIYDKRLFVDSDHPLDNEANGELADSDGVEYSDTAMAHIFTTHMISFAYRGLRSIGNTPDEIMSEAIMRGVHKGEAKFREVDSRYVDLDWDLDIEVSEMAELSPLEKWKRDLPMRPTERGRLKDRLFEEMPDEAIENAHPGEFDELVSEYLISDE